MTKKIEFPLVEGIRRIKMRNFLKSQFSRVRVATGNTKLIDD